MIDLVTQEKTKTLGKIKKKLSSTNLIKTFLQFIKNL